jgi:hypothetical protein
MAWTSAFGFRESNVLEGNGGGAAEKGAEEGPDTRDEDHCSF